jgi:hypothetical protein
MNTNVENYESHEAWLARQHALIEEANPVDYWTGEPQVRQLGYSRRDHWYWTGLTHTFLEAVFNWLARNLERFLIDVGDGLKRGLSNAWIVVPVVFIAAVVFMFLLGAGAL